MRADMAHAETYPPSYSLTVTSGVETTTFEKHEVLFLAGALYGEKALREFQGGYVEVHNGSDGERLMDAIVEYPMPTMPKVVVDRWRELQERAAAEPRRYEIPLFTFQGALAAGIRIGRETMSDGYDRIIAGAA